MFGNIKCIKQKYDFESILGIVLFIGFFLIFFMSPMRMDDLTWGSDMGIQRLQIRFAGYNGRYIGNILVIVLTRLPAAVRALFQSALVFCLIKVIYDFLGSHLIAFYATLLLFLLMPLTIFSQTVSWVAGFSNYFVSLVVILMVLKMELSIVLEDRCYNNLQLLLLYIISFLGQLILETSTIYICTLTLFCSIAYIVRYKRVSTTTAITFVYSVLGAVVMFSNTAYLAALQGDSSVTYKEIAVSANISAMLHKYGSTFVNTIVPKWMGNSPVLNITMVICLILINRNLKEKFSRLCIFMQLIGIMFLTFFIYNLIDIQFFSWGKFIYAIVTLSFWMYLTLTIFMSAMDSTTKLLLMVLSFSHLTLVAPLFIVNPIDDRCFLQPYIFGIILAGYLIKCQVKEPVKVQFFSDAKTQCGGVCVVFFLLCFLIAGQTLSWHIEQLRKQEIKHCIETNADTLILPNVPYSTQYCWGANIANENTYWLSNYKNYYGIPQNVSLSFVDYFYWKQMKCTQGGSEK